MRIQGLRLFLLTISISCGTLLIALDQFIANVSIPTIAGELGASRDDGSWIITTFTVANAMVIPLTGILTTFFGRVRLFCLSALLFTITSWLCGLSFNLPMLLIFRAMQGFVSGALIPLSQALLLLIYPPEKKALATGFWGLVVMVGPAMGPVLGGWITDNYGWPWIFYVNIPIGIASALITYFLMKGFESERKKVPIDWIGIALYMLGISALQIMLDRGNDLDWWHSPFIVALTITSIVAMTFFVIWEVFHKRPAIDLSFFKSRNFTLGSITISLAMMMLFASFIIEPLWVQDQLGYTPLWAGFTLAPIGLFPLILFPLVGYFVHYLDLRLWVFISFLIFSISFFWFSSLPIDAPFSAIALPRLFQGIGFALFVVPLTTISLSDIPEEKLPSAAGIYAFARLLFIGMGVALSITAWSRHEALLQTRFVEFVIPSNEQAVDYLQTIENTLQLDPLSSMQFINDVVVDQAYTFSMLDLFYISGWGFIFLMGLLFAFKMPRQ